MTRKGMEFLINKVCLTQGKVSNERIQAFESKLKELPYLENVVLRHYTNKQDLTHVAKVLDVSEDYAKRQFRKAIRHLHTPDRYYSLMLGLEGRANQLENHKGELNVALCGFTTRTVNTLRRNGFFYMEELEEFIEDVPERFTYIEGLGQYGMSEVLHFYYSKGKGK